MPRTDTALIPVEQGHVEGRMNAASGVASFLGLPYAAAPVGDLRFERPRPPIPWSGVRPATAFAARSLQRPPFADMVFRSTSMSEDCLTVNVWTARPGDTSAGLPILVYVHGGAFLVGDGSEPRHDGEALAAQGIVFVSVNYRLGLFGFFAHPQLRGANAGLFDLVAALDWLRSNVRAFGGDPDRITLAGSSSGAFAVCALLCSPLCKGKVAGAVVHSGSLLGSTLSGLNAELPPLEAWQRKGSRFAASLGAGTAQALKALPAQQLLDKSRAGGWNSPVVDGEFLTRDVMDTVEAGGAADVPLMAGIASAERSFDLSRRTEGFRAGAFLDLLAKHCGAASETLFRAYGSPQTPQEVRIAVRDFASDQWIGVGTFRLCAAMAQRGVPVFSYRFDHKRPAPRPGSGGWTSSEGAGHSTDIEYFLGTQSLTDAYDWRQEDRALSARMAAYIVNFVKTGNPNGTGLHAWPGFETRQRIVLSPAGGIESLAATALLASLPSDQAPQQ